MTAYERTLMTRYLEAKNHKKEALESMSDEEINSLYEQNSKSFISQWQQQLESIENSQAIRETEITQDMIQAVKLEHYKYYDVIENFIDLYSIQELVGLFFGALKDIKISRLEKMTRIKIREMQEIWLEGLDKNLSVLPDEEKQVLLEYYTEMKENLVLLRDAYTKSCDSLYINQLKLTADAKLYIIKDFMPNELEETYKAFYDHSKQKLDIIESILKISGAYSKKYLLSLSTQELQDLLESLKQQKEQERQNKLQIMQYLKTFDKAMRHTNDDLFTEACLNAAQDLSRQSFQELTMLLDEKYKNFRQRYNEAIKPYKDIPNFQVVF